MTLYQITALGHAALGTVALATYWTAGLSKKGSPVHRAAGKIYLLAMVALLSLALPLALSIVFAGKPVMGSFLLYLLVITSTAVWVSWSAIKYKRDRAGFTGPVYRGLMWLNLASGLAMAFVGLFLAQFMQVVISAFSLIGIVSFIRMWRFAHRQPQVQDPRWWLRQHLGAMLGNGVATHIAFLSIGLPRLLPQVSGPVMQNLAWLGPLLMSGVASIWLHRKYFPKPAAKASPLLAA